MGGTASAADGLYVCAQHYKGDDPDFEDEFANGPITVPAGTVFDYAGHAFGGAIDPHDFAHQPEGRTGWIGITDEERTRREGLLNEDADPSKVQHVGVVVTSPITLTKHRLCALARAEAIVSPEWRWSVDVVFGGPGVYYQAYGVIRAGKLETDWDTSHLDPFQLAAARGQVNGVVQGTLTRHLTLQPDNE